ncbi:hypothetical protein KY361_05735 [Candidatus Woesearchaeota archaeon]|nr:hypothetical protein [Candidatus Woesearchaeota archaeon]
MAKKIYGIDPSKKVTPQMARDAIITCFVKAHQEILDEVKGLAGVGTGKEFEELKFKDIKFRIKAIFDDIGRDFNNPTKGDLIKVVDRLAAYASNFRSPGIIKKHYGEIMQLINKIS